MKRQYLMILFRKWPSAPSSPLPGKVELNECWSIWVTGKVIIQQGPWKDWISFKSQWCPIHDTLSTSHLLTSPLLLGARTEREVNNSKRQKLFEFR
jgi:hypothetical protein